MRERIVLTLVLIFLLLPSCKGARPRDIGSSSAPAEKNPAISPPLEFLSDSDPGYRLLEKMQLEAYENNSRAFRWTGSPRQIELVAKIVSELGNREKIAPDESKMQDSAKAANSTPLIRAIKAHLGEKMPTRYEEPNSIWTLNRVASDINRTMGAKPIDWVSPRLGTLPIGTLNAQAIPLEGAASGSLVVVNSGLFSFCYEMAKIGLCTITFEQGADGQLVIDYSEDTFNLGPRRDQQLRIRLSKALEDFANGRRIRGQAPPNRLHDRLLVHLVSAMEDFAVGHEYGHVFLKHRSAGTRPLMLIGASSQMPEVEVISRSWRQEAAADVFGSMVVDDIIKDSMESSHDPIEKDLTKFCNLAPIFFFVLADMTDEANYVYRHGALPRQIDDAIKQQIILRLANELKTEIDRKGLKAPRPIGEKQQTAQSSAGEVSSPDPGDHPPNWARAIVMEAQYRSTISADATNEQRAFALMGIAMIRNMQVMWGDLKPQWVQIWKQLHEESGAIGTESGESGR